MLVRSDDAAVLPDAGLGTRTLAPMLKGVGFDPARLGRTNNSHGIALAAAKRVMGKSLGSHVRVAAPLRDLPSVVWRQGERASQLSLFGGREPAGIDG